MTADQIDFARRAVACQRWRWVPGMRWWTDDDHGRLDDFQPEYMARPTDALPDLSDAATLGCLLALVREAWGDPRLVAIYCEAAHAGQSEGWAVQTADNRLPVAGEDHETEAAALVAALEAAP
jgi:hypothetical protein